MGRYSIVNNHLFDNHKKVRFIQSPNISKTALTNVKALVMHYDAGSSDMSSESWFRNPTASASAHFIFKRKGDITQMVKLNQRAMHAGRSKWRALSSLNAYSIGFEMVNAGRLKVHPDDKLANEHLLVHEDYPKVKSVYSSDRDAETAIHRNQTKVNWWHLYTLEQIEKVVKVGREIVRHFGINKEYVVGHDQISPGRKIDPGPMFDMQEYKRLLYWEPFVCSKHGFYTNISPLNIRNGSGIEHKKLAPALKQGTHFMIHEADGSWVKIKTTEGLYGWVHSGWIINANGILIAK